jgi:site-specific DNA-cytosine methylase
LVYVGGISNEKRWLEDGKDNSRNFSQGQRVYATSGVASTLAGNAGGLGGKTGLYAIPHKSTGRITEENEKVAIPVLTPDRVEKRQNGRRFKTDGEPSFTLTGQDRHGVYDGYKIRKLTPKECERLQGFPDGWSEGISDTQRYKCLGNAVSVPVITALGERISAYVN